jgi:hypothetical protein
MLCLDLKNKGNVKTFSSIILGLFYADMTFCFLFFKRKKIEEGNQAIVFYFLLKTW